MAWNRTTKALFDAATDIGRMVHATPGNSNMEKYPEEIGAWYRLGASGQAKKEAENEAFTKAALHILQLINKYDE